MYTHRKKLQGRKRIRSNKLDRSSNDLDYSNLAVRYRYPDTSVDRSFEQLILLLADNSGSVAGKLAEKINIAISAGMRQLAGKCNRDTFRVSQINFGSIASLEHRAVAPNQVQPRIDGSGWGTRLSPGLVLAVHEIERFKQRSGRIFISPVVYLMVDGMPVDLHDAQFVTTYLKLKLNAQIIVLAIGQVNVPELMPLASSEEHFASVDSNQLEVSFQKLCKVQSVQLRRLFV